MCDQNIDTVQAAEVNAVIPARETEFDHVYRLSRPLFPYVKSEHIGGIPAE